MGKLHHKFSSFENFVFFCYHRTLYLFLVSCACGTLCSGRRRRHLAVARRTTGLLLLHPKIGVLLLETSSTLSTFTFQNLVKQQIVLAIRCSMYSALPAAPF